MILLLLIMVIGTIFTVYKVIRNTIFLKLNPINFQGRTIWITGASSGIGEALAIRLSHLGSDLILSSRRAQALELVKSKCNPQCKIQIVTMDLAEPMGATKLVESFLGTYQKPINMLVHNAGVSQRSKFLDFSYKNHEYMVNLNYNGPFAITQAIVRHMIKHNPRDKRNGSQLVVISSVAGKLNPGLRSSYCSSKAAISSLFESIRTEVQISFYDKLGESGVKVTQIYPGYVRSKGSRNALMENEGERYGNSDDNLKSGLDLDSFVTKAIDALYLEEQESYMPSSFDMHVGLLSINIIPELYNWFKYKHYKKSQGWVKNDNKKE